jgi:RNA recognition motif-containing protein
MNIYVGNVARSVTEEMLRQLFEAYGQVGSIKIPKDKFTGEPRGFAFVDMPDADHAQAAMNELNGREFERQVLRVNEAREPEARPRFGGSSGPRTGGPSSGGPRRFGSQSSGGNRWGDRPKRF